MTRPSASFQLSRRDAVLAAYAAVLVFTTAVMAGAFVADGVPLGSPLAVAALACIAVMAERESIRLTPTLQVSVSSLTLIFAAVVLGPLAAMVVGAAGLLIDLRRPYTRWLIWTTSRALVAGCAGLAALAFGGPSADSAESIVAAVVAATVVEALADLGLAGVTPVIRGTGTLRGVIRELLPLLATAIPFQMPLVAILAYAYLKVSPWSAALFVVPAFAAQRLFLLYRQQRETSEKLGLVNERLQNANLSFATALVATVEARDRYTAGHSAAVAIYARDIAARMGLPDEQQRLAHLCGLVHDVGKIGLPVGLLEKPGSLTLEERREMEKHSEIGEWILSKVEDYAEIARIVRHHHERVDGLGYPDGLKANQIPLISKIIAVADAYNAMTSDRPYRDAMPSRVARLRLAQASDSQFDTSIVAAFEAILAGATEPYRCGKRGDFSLESRDLDAAPRAVAV